MKQDKNYSKSIVISFSEISRGCFITTPPLKKTRRLTAEGAYSMYFLGHEPTTSNFEVFFGHLLVCIALTGITAKYIPKKMTPTPPTPTLKRGYTPDWRQR